MGTGYVRYALQLVFRSGPSRGNIAAVPNFVVKARQIIACIGISSAASLFGQFDITDRHRPGIRQVDVLVQFDKELTVFAILAGYDADVLICQISFVFCIAFHIDLLVQLNLGSITKVAGILHTVIQCGHFMCNDSFTVFGFIDESCYAIFTIETRFSISTFDGKTVCTVFTIQTNASVLTIDDYGRTILAIDTDSTVLAIFTICTFFTYSNAVTRNILVHQDIDGRIAISVLGYRRGQVIRCIFVIFLSCAAHDIDRAVQLIGNRIIRTACSRCIGTKLHTVIQCGHFMCNDSFTVFGFIDESCYAIFTIETRFSISTFDGKTVCTVFTIQTNASVLTIDDYGRTILAIDTDSTVLAICAGFTDIDIIFQIICNFHARIIGLFTDGSRQVITVLEVDNLAVGNLDFACGVAVPLDLKGIHSTKSGQVRIDRIRFDTGRAVGRFINRHMVTGCHFRMGTGYVRYALQLVFRSGAARYIAIRIRVPSLIGKTGQVVASFRSPLRVCD